MSDLDAIHSWEHWREFLFRLGAISSPADLQGFASGLLAGGATLDVEKWLALAEEFAGRFRVIDGNRSVTDVATDVYATVRGILA